MTLNGTYFLTHISSLLMPLARLQNSHLRARSTACFLHY